MSSITASFEKLRKISASKQELFIKAGKMMNEMMTKDQESVDLADLVKGPSSEQIVRDVTNTDEEFLKVYQISVPTLFMEQVDQMQCRCFMGILPEIDRAWITVDNKLYMWDYVNGGEVFGYEDQDQIINHVALVKPKRAVFGKQVDYMMILTTPLQILLLAVNVSVTSGVKHVQILATDMSVSTDGIQIVKMCSTENGRPFILCDDGHVYELEYTHPESWFYYPCRLTCITSTTFVKYISNMLHRQRQVYVRDIALDEERGILYILHSNSMIDVFDLGESKTKLAHVAKFDRLLDSARLMCRQYSTVYEDGDLELESIHVVPTVESTKVHLVAVSAIGFRFYFSHHQDAVRFPNINPNQRPNTLEMINLRLPPSPDLGRSTELRPGRGQKCYSTYYGIGVMMTARHSDDGRDVLITAAADVDDTAGDQPKETYFMYPRRRAFMETQAVMELDGRAFAIAEVTSEIEKYGLKEISRGIGQPTRRFLILTNKSITMYCKQRPVDILYRLLLKADGEPETLRKEFSAYFDRYGQAQACAMCLGIVCTTLETPIPQQENLIRTATKLFFDYGGQPTAGPTPHSQNHLGNVTNVINVKYSAKHDAFVLFLSRLVAKIWKMKFFVFPSDINTAILNGESVIPTEFQSTSTSVRHHLTLLKNFLDANSSFHTKANITDARFSTPDSNLLRVLLAEQQSLNEMYSLLVQCMEAIIFIDFVLDAGTTEIFQCVPEHLRREISELTLEDMLTTPRGRTLARELVVGTIRKFDSVYTHTDFGAVSSLLQRRCSSFFGPSDMAFYKGIENLRQASQAETSQERINMLATSVKLFKDATDFLTDEKLREICGEYSRQCYHIGTIELALDRASRVDVDGLAFIYMDSESPHDDARVSFYNARLRCYQNVFDALRHIMDLRQDPTQIPADINITDIDMYASKVLSSALTSTDKLFHCVLYNWLLQNNLMSILVTVDTESFIPFFQQYVERNSAIDFLWQYHRYRGEYYKAAIYLEMLACETPNLDHRARLEYLSLAVVNVRCRQPNDVPKKEYIETLRRLEGSVTEAREQERLSHGKLG